MLGSDVRHPVAVAQGIGALSSVSETAAPPAWWAIAGRSGAHPGPKPRPPPESSAKAAGAAAIARASAVPASDLVNEPSPTRLTCKPFRCARSILVLLWETQLQMLGKQSVERGDGGMRRCPLS